MTHGKKLIELAPPLETINAARAPGMASISRARSRRQQDERMAV